MPGRCSTAGSAMSPAGVTCPRSVAWVTCGSNFKVRSRDGHAGPEEAAHFERVAFASHLPDRMPGV